MRLHVLHHIPFEWLGTIEDWATGRGMPITSTRFFEEDRRLPDINAIDLVVSMGGPMGVYEGDIHPWIDEEKAFLRQAIAAEKHVLGICLGAQMIASALGAEVAAHPVREIGIFPVHLTPEGKAHPLLAGFPESLDVLHWHGDRFAIPVGAAHIAESAACPPQGFIYKDKVLAFQCHPEMTAQGLEALIENDAASLARPEDYIQNVPTLRRLAPKLDACRAPFFSLLDGWLEI